MNAPAIKVKMGSAEIASAMRRDILQGELAKHDRLPAERLWPKPMMSHVVQFERR